MTALEQALTPGSVGRRQWGDGEGAVLNRAMTGLNRSLHAHSHVFLFQLKDNKVFDVPVAVIAGNRPNYLYR